ncbi:hypothetical protein AVEN_49924-1 [Araneus ventricosus]|uniref:Uncharacterized protein n=1 Tax=Araneus ventricosus TaxID=182803 RepID=A0A4Y2QEW6_ARAVE|nr:hypothetical protein AVEN_236165-1 [Araneus ventricosus]GBN62064.1 hypothetical protein AVEN_49924-1 [Araneus ventricosus]
MSGHWISKGPLASPWGVVMVGLWIPPPAIVYSSGGVRPWPGDRLLSLRPQYSNYCSVCHSDDPDASAGRGGVHRVFLVLRSIDETNARPNFVKLAK